ncbi:helix-turn-helix transcriptional regulator [Streptomyces sp. ISL-99]|nr:helix-turn-helix transcriptional regulator [Streptomyces sp. ISL-99]
MSEDPIPDGWLLEQRRLLGQRIWAARTHANLTQGRLAERAGIDRKTVYRAELATHTPSYEQVLRIAYALGVPLSELVRQ